MKKCKQAIKLGNETQDMQKCRLGTQINAIPKAIGKNYDKQATDKKQEIEENKASYKTCSNTKDEVKDKGKMVRKRQKENARSGSIHYKVKGSEISTGISLVRIIMKFQLSQHF